MRLRLGMRLRLCARALELTERAEQSPEYWCQHRDGTVCSRYLNLIESFRPELRRFSKHRWQGTSQTAPIQVKIAERAPEITD